MNYLTNYYKNLAEKLEYQVNNLETQVKFINEAMSNYGPSRGRQMGMGDSMYSGSMTQGDLNNDGMVDGADLGLQLGRGGNPNDITSMYSSQYQVDGPAFRSTTSGRRPSARGRQTTTGDSSYQGPRVANPARGVASMGDSSYGGSRMPGDYNGDGRVDGADLGLGLSNNYGTSTVTQNWTLPYQQGGPASMRMANRGPSRGRQMGMGDSSYGGSRTPGDLNNDGMVDGADLGLQLGSGGNPNDIVSNYTSPYQVGGQADFRSTNTNRNRRRSR
jgi:hypothetical protein